MYKIDPRTDHEKIRLNHSVLERQNVSIGFRAF